MTERAYTVLELAALRALVRHKYIFGTYKYVGGTSRGYDEAKMNQVVEEHVRTHMIAGHIASDLLDSEPDAAQ